MRERDGGRVSGAGERGAVRAVRVLTEERRGVVIPSIIFENIPPSPVDFFFDIDGRRSIPSPSPPSPAGVSATSAGSAGESVVVASDVRDARGAPPSPAIPGDVSELRRPAAPRSPSADAGRGLRGEAPSRITPAACDFE